MRVVSSSCGWLLVGASDGLPLFEISRLGFLPLQRRGEAKQRYTVSVPVPLDGSLPLRSEGECCGRAGLRCACSLHADAALPSCLFLRGELLDGAAPVRGGGGVAGRGDAGGETQEG